MEKIINVNGKEVKLKTNAGLVRRYREWFKRDLTSDMQKVLTEILGTAQGENVSYTDVSIEALEIFENVSYAMNRYADPECPDNIDDWLEQFETFDIYTIFPELIMLWTDDTEVTSKNKKK